MAAAVLMLEGWDVFRSVSPSAKFDLLAFRDGGSVRIEVTTGFMTGPGKLYHSKKMDPERFDVLAVVIAETREIHWKQVDGATWGPGCGPGR